MTANFTTAMQVHEIASYSDFIALLEERYFREQRGTWIFRGLSKESYSLVPSVGRLKHTASSREKLESSLFDQFKLQAIQYLPRVPTNDFEWLALAQHYGLPTRLLDWTFNPQIALYFASREDRQIDGRVFALRTQGILGKTSIQTQSPFSMCELHKFIPSVVTNRLAAQEGLFTIQINVEVPLEEEKRDDWELEAILIPARLKESLTYLLFRLGVHQASLFPDIDGLAAHIKWQHTVSPDVLQTDGGICSDPSK